MCETTQGDKTGILAHQYLDDDELEYALTVEQKWEADWLSAENAKLRYVVMLVHLVYFGECCT